MEPLQFSEIVAFGQLIKTQFMEWELDLLLEMDDAHHRTLIALKKSGGDADGAVPATPDNVSKFVAAIRTRKNDRYRNTGLGSRQSPSKSGKQRTK
jgi:hypothetical protein